MATYFVKNGGNDNLDGLSDANAWATLAKVNGFTFGPGDVVQFKCGSKWENEQLTKPVNGTNYGTGVPPVLTQVIFRVQKGVQK